MTTRSVPAATTIAAERGHREAAASAPAASASAASAPATGSAAGADATAADRGVVTVTARRELAEGVVEFTLARPDGSRLPDWTPGAHIDVVLADGTVRQYSLCGDRWDASAYRIAVQREADGRGGSIALHDEVRVGDALGFGGPRNTFRLAPATGYLFVAGGIGITPILPMIDAAELLGVPWRLRYLGRSRARLAYLDRLEAFGDRVVVHCADERGRAALDEWRGDDPGVRVYACGPDRLLTAVEAWGALPGGYAPRVERFSAAAGDFGPPTPFEVLAARSGVTVTVGEHESTVAALRRVGVGVLTSCGQGVCGTCETEVLEGTPDHRDALLDDAERAAGATMFPCVSRCHGACLVLDL